MSEKIKRQEIVARNSQKSLVIVGNRDLNIDTGFFPSPIQRLCINICKPYIKLFSSPEYYIKLCIDPSDIFATTKNPFMKMLGRLLILLGPIPKKTGYKTISPHY
jgi:hypothetical protein